MTEAAHSDTKTSQANRARSSPNATKASRTSEQREEASREGPVHMPNARKIPGLRSEGQAEKPKHHSRDSEGRSCKLERQRDSFSRGADQSDVPTPDTAASATGASEASRDCWQAIWSAPHNAYYFWNSLTNTTTWINPLESARTSEGGPMVDPASGGFSKHTYKSYFGQQSDLESVRDQATGLDPDLAFLDPILYAASSAGSGGGGEAYTARGTFDRRTGRFVPASTSHDPCRHSQTAKAKRQMEAYFDVDEWQRSREADLERQAKGDKKQKSSHHPTRKELELYKERRNKKRDAKYGWLRT